MKIIYILREQLKSSDTTHTYTNECKVFVCVCVYVGNNKQVK